MQERQWWVLEKKKIDPTGHFTYKITETGGDIYPRPYNQLGTEPGAELRYRDFIPHSLSIVSLCLMSTPQILPSWPTSEPGLAKGKSEESPCSFKMLGESSSTALPRSASVKALGSFQGIFHLMFLVFSVKPKLKYKKTLMQDISPSYRPGVSSLFLKQSNRLLPWTLALVSLFLLLLP